MLVEKVKKYYDMSYDLNCAECILVAGGEEFDIEINEQTLRSMGTFGGGMGIGSVCGVVTGGVSLLGILFVEGNGHSSSFVKLMTSEFIHDFNERVKSLQCTELKGIYINSNDDRCIKIMIEGAEALNSVIQKYKDKYKINRK